ncbi:MAG: 6-phosphofructokinase, partial [Deltaproteobacteria bacterium]|nr:6-phosphofructokinase [Deltaproteobacteria bacterium]
MTDDNLAREREQEKLRRLLILTGGDDAPGLNAVLRAFVKTATDLDMRVFGSEDGFAGLIAEPARIVRLTPASVQGILPKGGSVLGCSNDANPFAYPTVGPDGITRTVDVSGHVKAT